MASTAVRPPWHARSRISTALPKRPRPRVSVREPGLETYPRLGGQDSWQQLSPIHDGVAVTWPLLADVTSLVAATPAPAFTDAPPGKRVLVPLARLDVEQAREFLMDLDAAAAAASPLLAMFLLGRCAEHAQRLLDVCDAAVSL